MLGVDHLVKIARRELRNKREEASICYRGLRSVFREARNNVRALIQLLTSINKVCFVFKLLFLKYGSGFRVLARCMMNWCM